LLLETTFSSLASYCGSLNILLNTKNWNGKINAVIKIGINLINCSKFNTFSNKYDNPNSNPSFNNNFKTKTSIAKKNVFFLISVLYVYKEFAKYEKILATINAIVVAIVPPYSILKAL
jgi:hypothetical protein